VEDHVLERARVSWGPGLLRFAGGVEHVPKAIRNGGTLAPTPMESSQMPRANGEPGLSDSVAGEVQALLAATEEAAEALKGQARREIDAAIDDLSTLVAELRDAANRLEERLEEIRGTTRAQVAAAPERDSLRRARLVAVNMAANGASRAETARYLGEHFPAIDREGLLDSVYETLGG
jgi:hypothetical protein